MSKESKKKAAPDNRQTPEDVAAYYRGVKPGDVAVLRCTQGNVLEYKLDKISDINSRLGRVYLERGESAWAGRAFYSKTGKSCHAPGGQTNLIVPTPQVLKWIEDHPMPVMTYDVDWVVAPPGQRNARRMSILSRPKP